MATSIFPEEMSGKIFTLESIAGKLKSFSAQLHLMHWQTMSYAEHKALDALYEFVNDFTDSVIEELMGYTSKRVGSFNIDNPKNNVDVKTYVKEIGKWAYDLEEWAEQNNYCNIENKSQELSGISAKTLYLLTLT